MALNDIKRTHYARQIDRSLIGQQVRVGGWIEDMRDIGKLAFATKIGRASCRERV